MCINLCGDYFSVCANKNVTGYNIYSTCIKQMYDGVIVLTYLLNDHLLNQVGIII